MNLNEFYDEVSRKADTDTLKIGAAETKRVLSEAFLVLSGLDSATLLEILTKGIANAKKKAEKPAAEPKAEKPEKKVEPKPEPKAEAEPEAKPVKEKKKKPAVAKV